MKRLLAALLAGAAVFSIAFASAAALNVDGEVIQAGQTTDVSCDEDGVQANWGLETGDNTVYNVRISDISSDCIGAKMWVKVFATSGDIGPVSVTVDSGSETFSLGGASGPAPEAITGLRVWIEG